MVLLDAVEALGFLAIGTSTTLAKAFDPPVALVSHKSHEDASTLVICLLDVMVQDSPVTLLSFELVGRSKVGFSFTHDDVSVRNVREHSPFSVDVNDNVEHLDFAVNITKLDSNIFVIFSIATSAGKVVSADTYTIDLLFVEGVADSNLVFLAISSDNTDIQVNVAAASPVQTKDDSVFNQTVGKSGESSAM